MPTGATRRRRRGGSHARHASCRARSAGARRRRSSGRSATAPSATCSRTTRAATRCAASSPRSRASRSTRTSRSSPRCSRCASAPCGRAAARSSRSKISDGTGILTLTFFNQAWRARDLAPGRARHLRRQGGRLQGRAPARAPRLRAVRRRRCRSPPATPPRKRWAEAPIPIYPATGDARELADREVDRARCSTGSADVDDPVPGRRARGARRCSPSAGARARSTAPRRDGRLARRARRTLRFTEAFVLQTALLQQRAPSSRAHATTARRPAPGGLLERFDAALPFTLTGDQRRRRRRDRRRPRASPVPMNRLVQGEVGSGKTVVALRAMLAVADSGGQSALLAPTEVLAAQHLRSIVAHARPRPRGRARADPAHRSAARRRAQEGAAARRCRPVAHRRRHARAHRRRRRRSPTSASSSSTSSTGSGSSSARRCG